MKKQTHPPISMTSANPRPNGNFPHASFLHHIVKVVCHRSRSQKHLVPYETFFESRSYFCKPYDTLETIQIQYKSFLAIWSDKRQGTCQARQEYPTKKMKQANGIHTFLLPEIWGLGVVIKQKLPSSWSIIPRFLVHV